jgi:high frequency lysogenization protein
MPKPTVSQDPRILKKRNRIFALAAMLQAAKQVHAIARTGQVDAVDFEACVRILFADSKDDVAAMCGGEASLRHGLILLNGLIQGNAVDGARALMSYAASMTVLERKMAKDRKRLKRLADGMKRTSKQVEYFGSVTHENVIAGLAAIYEENISSLNPRIIVHGKPEHLGHASSTNKVRALLFSGIRAAHLWHMNGGGKWKLIFARKSIASETEKLLKEI